MPESPNPGELSVSDTAALEQAAPAASPDAVVTEENLTVLDVHPAHHAASTWKDSFIHIATIVVGLCITVG